MYSKIALNNCKCNHCQEKLKQINRSTAYWEKLILSKNFIKSQNFKTTLELVWIREYKHVIFSLNPW